MSYNTRRLYKRLASQLKHRGVKRADYVAKALLKKRGHLNTAIGQARQNLGNAGRAKDRAAKYNGGKPSDYKYNKRTNIATKRG